MFFTAFATGFIGSILLPTAFCGVSFSTTSNAMKTSTLSVVSIGTVLSSSNAMTSISGSVFSLVARLLVSRGGGIEFRRATMLSSLSTISPRFPSFVFDLSSHIREATSIRMGGCFGFVVDSFLSSSLVLSNPCFEEMGNSLCCGGVGNGTIDDATRIKTAIKYGIITGIAILRIPKKLRLWLYFSCRRSCDNLNCSDNKSSSKVTRLFFCVIIAGGGAAVR
mmetsp:Transcript_30416/g.65265  ORF Transcript_30416/g.65265 Transcript_30416/m.65265 type:complete len:222 (-) Transcript_30416:66-731(-)